MDQARDGLSDATAQQRPQQDRSRLVQKNLGFVLVQAATDHGSDRNGQDPGRQKSDACESKSPFDTDDKSTEAGEYTLFLFPFWENALVQLLGGLGKKDEEGHPKNTSNSRIKKGFSPAKIIGSCGGKTNEVFYGADSNGGNSGKNVIHLKRFDQINPGGK